MSLGEGENGQCATITGFPRDGLKSVPFNIDIIIEVKLNNYYFWLNKFLHLALI